MIFLKQAHVGKSDLWRWLSIILIMFILLFVNEDIREIFNHTITNFTSFFPTTSGLIKTYGVNILYLLFFMMLCYVFHRRSLKSFIVFKQFNFVHLFLALFWASFLYSILIAIEILINPSAYQFSFNLSGFIELFSVGAVLISLRTLFHQTFFNGYLLQFSSLLCKNKWCMILISSLITIAFKLYIYHDSPIFNIHFIIFITSFALFYNTLALLTNGLEVVIGVYFAQNFLASIFISENWFDVTTNALFVSIPSRELSNNLNIFINFYLPIIFAIIQLFVLIKVFHLDNWKKRII